MKIAFRVDASATIGLGHLMRCLTLADALKKRGAETRFVVRHCPPPLRELIGTRQHQLVELPKSKSVRPADDSLYAAWLGTDEATDAEDTGRALSDQPWDWLVVDHYALGSRWEAVLHGTARHSLVVDDLADREHDCDLLLNQNFQTEASGRYRGSVPSRCRLLLGPRFALLRDEFRQWRERSEIRSGPVSRVLVCFGGSDTENHTRRAIEALSGAAARGFAVDVVIGAAHPDPDGVRAACAALGFAFHLQSGRMAELMARADLALGAGGATTWERCCLGVPALVFGVADNQREQVREAARAGVIVAPDVPADGISAPLIERHCRALIENGALRSGVSRRAMEAVDGKGVGRVIRHVLGVDIELRQAGTDDCAKLFQWRNHPSVRAVSRSPEALDWDGHQRWFAAALADPQKVLLIGRSEGVDFGVVRFDIEGQEAEVSIYLVPGSEPSGTGSQLLPLAEQRLISLRPDVRRCRASVLGANVASHRLFVGCGYTVVSTMYSKRLSPT